MRKQLANRKTRKDSDAPMDLVNSQIEGAIGGQNDTHKVSLEQSSHHDFTKLDK